MEVKPCGQECIVYQRVVGYFSPLTNWNNGKKSEFKLRKTFNLDTIDKVGSKEIEQGSLQTDKVATQ